MIDSIDPKEIKDLQDTTAKLKGSLNKNIVLSIKPVNGTVNTGDTATDTTINNLITAFNLLLSNISGQ